MQWRDEDLPSSQQCEANMLADMLHEVNVHAFALQVIFATYK